MPVQKFRRIEDMPPVPRCKSLDAECLRRIAGLWEWSSAFGARIYPRGVFKFRSIEEAQVARERVTRENIDRLRREHEAAQSPSVTPS